MLAESDITVLRHSLEASVGIGAFCRWILILRPLHNALVEDSLDRAEREVHAEVARPKEWGLGVHLLRNLVKAHAALFATRNVTEDTSPRCTEQRK